MDAKTKKIVEWGIALVIIVSLITMILPQFISVIQTSGKPFYMFLSPLFFYIPIIVFALLHYIILQKMLGQQFTFQHLRRHPQINTNRLRGPISAISAYITMASLTLSIFFSIMLLGHYFNLKEIINLLGPAGLFILLLAPITTGMLLIFSNFFFAKPVKETWKAILLAGIIAGAAGVALEYGLEKFIGPYLPIRTGKVPTAVTE